jgi:omega-amidase
MKVALVQPDISWENIPKNLAYLEKKIDLVEPETDLVVLPEMFSTGFTMNPEEVAETTNGQAVTWMLRMAKKYRTALTGSVIIKEEGNYYNRLFFVSPDGKIQSYNKRHLFTLAGEQHKYTKGKEKLIVDYKGWKICLLICYDLRFPVFSRNIENYDLLIYVASWPKKRIKAWDTLLKARAVENMVYTIGVNRTGVDPTSLYYNGHSQAIDSLGEYLLEPQQKEGVFTIILDKEKQSEIRNRFGFLNDKDSFILE